MEKSPAALCAGASGTIADIAPTNTGAAITAIRLREVPRFAFIPRRTPIGAHRRGWAVARAAIVTGNRTAAIIIVSKIEMLRMIRLEMRG